MIVADIAYVVARMAWISTATAKNIVAEAVASINTPDVQYIRARDVVAIQASSQQQSSDIWDIVWHKIKALVNGHQRVA